MEPDLEPAESSSDLSRPASSLFSRSTDLCSGRSSNLCSGRSSNLCSGRSSNLCSGRSSNLCSGRSSNLCSGRSSNLCSGRSSNLCSGRSSNLCSGRSSNLCSGLCSGPTSDLLDVDVLSPRPAPVVRLSPVSHLPPPEPTHHRSLVDTPTATPLSRTEAFSSGLHIEPDEPLSRSTRDLHTHENLHRDPAVDPGRGLFLDSDPGPATLACPSTTRSSCPSPQRGTRSQVAPTPSSPPPGWPVLPPISPVRGSSATSRRSELSCSHSRVFDELEAIAPSSVSSPSLSETSDSSGRTSPDTELSPGLAALTVGCDSGNLGSLSRVQLLLLDRGAGPRSRLSPAGLREEEALSPMEDWSDLDMRCDSGLTSAGAWRPLTAGGVSERCDSAGKVHGNKSDQSEGGSGSPSSWIIDRSPSSLATPGSSPPPCRSSHAGDGGGPAEEESHHSGGKRRGEAAFGGGRPESSAHNAEVEERKTKVLNVFSKLQDEAPRQGGGGSVGRANFEDFDFLAKYCIFSQEKLAEYKRAFEAEDVDGDGYLSCMQVLLALKNILPPELLSEEEEIYVYRILEMVDFRVTDGLVDLRLFAVIASLAQKIASMDEFMRSLVSNMDFRSLEVRLFKAKQLFLFLLEEQRGDAPGAEWPGGGDSAGVGGFISAEQLLLELKAGGVRLEREAAAVRLELRRLPPLDLLGFLAYLPLFMLIHKSVIANPLADAADL